MRDVAYIALGSNIGDRLAHLSHARAALALLPGSEVTAESSIEETAPLGPVPQGPYLNQMIALSTDLSPRALLHELHEIERAQGRVRDVRWGPRTIDLDIVCFGVATADLPELRVPHPSIAERDFWQRELAELGAPCA